MVLIYGQNFLNSQYNLLPENQQSIVDATGTHATATGSSNNSLVYENFVKGLTSLLKIIHHSLSAGYINFGFIRFYEDSSLDNMLNVFLTLLVTKLGDCTELLKYPKSVNEVYLILDLLSEDHLDWLISSDTKTFEVIFPVLANGLTSFNNIVQTKSCSSIDNFATFLFKHVEKQKILDILKNNQQDFPGLPEFKHNNLTNFLHANSQILTQLLDTCFHHLIFEECKNMWSFSRPLLPLILLNPDHFAIVQNSIIEQAKHLAPDKKSAERTTKDIQTCFKNLMSEIENNLEPKNRDKFTHELTKFNKEMRVAIRGQESHVSHYIASTRNYGISLPQDAIHVSNYKIQLEDGMA